MHIKTSKRKKIACLTFCAFFAFYAFYAHKKHIRGGKLLVCVLCFLCFLCFSCFSCFLCMWDLLVKKNKEVWNCPDTLIYYTTDVYPPWTCLSRIYVYTFIFTCENHFFFMISCKNLFFYQPFTIFCYHIKT